MQKQYSRRTFLQSTAALTLGAPLIAPAHAWAAGGRAMPSERITIGIIGMGRMGLSLLRSLINEPNTQIVALSDIAKVRLDHAVNLVHEAYAEQKASGAYTGCAAYNDFREIINRPDIDAVVVATPDHWHAIPSIMAADAKKHVYCEKPLSLTIAEGRAMVNAARRNNIVFQTGSQQRSEFNGRFRIACEMVRNGRIGRIQTIRVGVGAPAVACDLPEEPVPAGIDWDMWLGPAAYRGYNEILCPKGNHTHFPLWRDYREYAGGILADMGAHHFDIAQWALDMDNSGPVEIQPPVGAINGGLMFRYANGVEMYHGGPSGTTFNGTDGSIYVDRSRLEASREEILNEPLGSGDIRLEDNGRNHKQNWLDCIQTGKRPIADVEVGHRTATICQLANLGYQHRRNLHWDPAAERFVDDEEANTWLDVERRKPWVI